jgi:hypothetical protein
LAFCRVFFAAAWDVQPKTPSTAAGVKPEYWSRRWASSTSEARAIPPVRLQVVVSALAFPPSEWTGERMNEWQV